MGVKSIALSLAKGFRGAAPIPWDTARVHGPGVVKALLDAGWPDGVVMNVNFPDREPNDVEGIEVTRQGFRDQHIVYADKRTDLRGETYYWLGFHGTLSRPPDGVDLKAIYEGRISITPLHIDLTHEPALAALRGAFAAREG
jgi:5'-nucleotidase